MVCECPCHAFMGIRFPESVPQLERVRCADVEQLLERERLERRGRTIRQCNGEIDVEIACRSSCSEREVEHVSGDPQSFEIRYRSAGSEMSPRVGRIVSDHPCQL